MKPNANRTKLQNSIIHASKNNAKISNDNYRALVFRISAGRTESSADLTVKEANELIEALGGTAPGKALNKPRHKAGNNVTNLPSEAQTSHLKSLAVQRWGAENYATAFSALCQHTISKPKPLTAAHAKTMIEAIKAMNKRDSQKKSQKKQEAA